MKRLLIVAILIALTIVVINLAPEYDLVYKYRADDVRVILNDNEITSSTYSLPQSAIKVDGNILISYDTIRDLFDRNIYKDDTSHSVITMSDANDKKLEFFLGSKKANFNDAPINLAGSPVNVEYDYAQDVRYDNLNKSSEILYFPAKALEEVFDLDIVADDKLIITEKNKNMYRGTIPEKSSLELKVIKDVSSKTIEKLNPGDTFDIFDTNYEDFAKIRSYTGEIGYVPKEKLEGISFTQIYFDTAQTDNIARKSYNIAWDYVNKDHTTIGDMATRSKISNIDIVAPTILYLNGDNKELKYSKNVLKEYLAWANKQNYEVWITLKNDDCSLSQMSDFLKNNEHRKNLISELMDVVDGTSITGINVDFEYLYKENAKDLVEFVRELTYEGHKNNLIISVCVNVPDGSENWSLCYDHRSLSECSDYLTLMAYDQFGNSSKVAGPSASYAWVETNLDKIINREKVDSLKVILGMPLYSRYWYDIRNDDVSKNNIYMKNANKYLANSKWDEDARQYYYESKDGKSKMWIENADSTNAKLKLIDEYSLGGSAFWRLGFEEDDFFSKLKF